MKKLLLLLPFVFFSCLTMPPPIEESDGNGIAMVNVDIPDGTKEKSFIIMRFVIDSGEKIYVDTKREFTLAMCSPGNHVITKVELMDSNKVSRYQFDVKIPFSIEQGKVTILPVKVLSYLHTVGNVSSQWADLDNIAEMDILECKTYFDNLENSGDWSFI